VDNRERVKCALCEKSVPRDNVILSFKIEEDKIEFICADCFMPDVDDGGNDEG